MKYLTEQNLRENIEEEWTDHIWPRVISLANDLGVAEEDLLPPRRAERQVHRANPPGDLSPSDFYKITIGVPAIDRVINDLGSRFGHDQLKISKLLSLSPPVLITKTVTELRHDFDEVLKHFSSIFDQEETENFYREIPVLQSLLKRRLEESTGLTSLIELFKVTQDTFIVTNKLVQIILTFPITSNEGERSFSVLRRLYSWLRTTMKTDRLCNLARMQVHPARLASVSNAKIIDKFRSKKARRFETNFIEYSGGNNFLSFFSGYIFMF